MKPAGERGENTYICVQLCGPKILYVYSGGVGSATADDEI